MLRASQKPGEGENVILARIAGDKLDRIDMRFTPDESIVAISNDLRAQQAVTVIRFLCAARNAC